MGGVYLWNLRVCTRLGASVAALCAGQSLAQDVTNQAAERVASTNEIIVTAQKRSERLEDVPIAMTAVNGDVLERQGVTNIQDVAQISPGVTMGRLAVYVQPTIRGVASLTGGVGQSNNAAVYVDGFIQPTQVSLNQDLLSVDQIQILKGPQGTLFGRNATSGAILISTRDPQFTLGGRLQASYGRFNDWTTQGYVTGPVLQDKIAVDLSLYHRESDGYFRDTGGFDPAVVRNTSARMKLLVIPSDRAKITTILEYNRVRDGANATRIIVGRSLVAANFPSVLADHPEFYSRRPYLTSLSTAQESDNEVLAAALGVDLDLNDVLSFRSLSRYSKEQFYLLQDGDGTRIRNNANEQSFSTNTLTQEFNLNGDTNHFKWVVGAFFMRLSEGSDGTRSFIFTAPTLANPLGTQTLSAIRGNRILTKSYAVFADGTLDLTDNFALTAGIRYSKDEKSERNFDLIPIERTNYARSASWSSVTPRVALRYEVRPRTSVYASWGKGFKGGAFPQGFNSPEAGPETNTSYEVGIKTASSRLRFDLSAYQMNYKNLQVTSNIFLPQINGPASIFANVPKSRIRGVESQISFAVSDRLNLNAGAAYTHARYGNFSTAPGYRLTAAGLNAALQTNDMDISGNRMLRAPDWTFNIAADYAIPTSVGTFRLNGSLSYSSEYAVSDLSLFPAGGNPNGPYNGDYRYVQPAFERVNLQASFSPGDGPLTVTAYGKNVTNSLTYNYYVASVRGDGAFFGEPATYGVKVDYRF